MKKKWSLKKTASFVYLFLCVLLETLFFCLILLGMDTDLLEESSEITSAILISAGFWLISFFGVLRVKQDKDKVVGTTFWMKAVIFCFGMALNFFLPPFQPGPALTFTFIGALVLIAVIPYCRTAAGPKDISVQNSSDTSDALSYKAKWAWDAAAREYLTLKGMESLSELTEEENDLIYDYASMPVIYLFTWLIEHEMMCEEFYSDFSTELPKEIRAHEASPLEWFRSMDYCLIKDDFSENVLPFLRKYWREFSEQSSDEKEPVFYDDYQTCIKNKKHSYYCVHFSWNVYDKLSKKIDAAYKYYTESIE